MRLLSRLIWWRLGRKYGFDVEKNLQFLRESQYWSDDRMHSYHKEKLQALISHAYENVPFYKKLFDSRGLKPSDIKDIADLEKLPVIRKRDILDNKDDFMAVNRDSIPYMHHFTGGTTGIPCPYFNDRKSWAMQWALKMRTFEWGGFRYGKDRLAVMAGGSLIPGKTFGPRHTIWRLINNYYTIPISHLTPELMSEHARQIKKQKIKFMRGYPSAITTFAEYVLDKGLDVKLTSIFTTAEKLFPHQRELIKKAFSCDVYDTYGCGDGMAYATECELHDQLHICQELSILQIVNSEGKQVQEGEEGEVVLTSLYDFAMPFIRYAPGDRAIRGRNHCTCGRNSSMMEIIGRSTDSFKFSNGRVFNGLSIPFEDLTTNVEKFQICQEEVDRVCLYLVPRSEITESDIDGFRKLLEYHCGEGVVVEVKLVDHIEVSKSSKDRYVISKVAEAERNRV